MTTKARDYNKITYLSYLLFSLGILNGLGLLSFLGFFGLFFKKFLVTEEKLQNISNFHKHKVHRSKNNGISYLP